jgi:type I restriction enzyme S subunit
MSMSRIDQLIQELCPDGVKFNELGDLISRVDGSNRKIVKSKIQATGEYPVYTQGANQKPDGYSDDTDSVIRDLPVILYGDHTNSLKWIDHAFIAGADGVKLVKASSASGLENKFLYYCLRDQIKHIPDGYARHFSKLRKLKIPVPPLEVQKEIVEILDKFTQLEAELEAELEARRKQYEFYRNQLLTFNNEGGGTMDNSRGGRKD